MTTNTAAPATPPGRSAHHALGEDSRSGVPVGPMLSMFDPVFLGRDEYGSPVYAPLIYRNLLIGGEPGGGKSTLLSSIVAHAARHRCAAVSAGRQTGRTRPVARGRRRVRWPEPGPAISTLRRLQTVMDNRYACLGHHRQRKITRGHRLSAILCAVDEIAYYSATVGDRPQQEQFVALLRDLVARGRAVGLIVVAATQRPSVDIIPTSLRDIFSWRFATRCTTEASSDIILGRGWAENGYNAAHIAPEDQGCGFLIAEGGIPRLVKAAYLSDADIVRVAAHAAWTRHHHTTTPPAAATVASGRGGALR